MTEPALTPVEIADLLDAAYRADHGSARNAPIPETRAYLADLLGCHDDLRAAVWALWREQLVSSGDDLGAAEDWLDVEFIEPCPEERPNHS
ncbi:hypothetical protein LAJ19_17980 (plasmid) [Deinococcus taeanensis]|uniref:hypothetical protein n=1 Tax=Deinococcus taeanensis TaxID=2737050 RepID=UPI001CDC7959|nr:hypothetical protein [Deinococcus taeanensis]UBV45017.1 hypothetical protein LAJ19_17980 [Deinococcus taeanensis]